MTTQKLKAAIKKWVPRFAPPGKPDLFYVNNILSTLWSETDGSLPRLGNPEDPLDDLIYLMLTRRGKIHQAQQLFVDLGKSLPKKSGKIDWSYLLQQDIEAMARRFAPLGMGKTRAREICATLTLIQQRFGELSLDALHQWSNDRCIEFLCTLPGVSLKTATCVMLYTLGRQIFPSDVHCNRILARLGIIPAEYGRQDRHKKAQKLLLDGRIPGEMAFSLHVTLIRHGQEICTSINPQCQRCPLRGFCAEYRERASKQWEADSKKPSCVDLFSGAGGTSVGISRPIEWGHDPRAATTPTMRIVLAAELDRWAHKTYSTNHPEIPVERVLLKDLTDNDAVRIIRKAVANEPNLVLVFEGPPCQNVSLIGTTGRKAATAKRKRFAPPTYVAFRDIVKSLRTGFFVMENVPGLFAAGDGRAREDIIEDFSDLYASKEVHVEANDHGVPQRRHRILIVGVLKGKKPGLASKALEFLAEQLRTPLERSAWSATFGEAVSDLPTVKPAQGQEFGKHHTPGTVNLSGYQETLRNGSELIYNHVARPNNERDLELYALLEPGEIAWDAHEKYQRHDLMIYRNDVFLDKYRRQVWDAPSTTVVAHLAKDRHMFIHPRQVRSITVREAARLQSFPDDFIMMGPRTEQFRQVGNAAASWTMENPSGDSHAKRKSLDSRRANRGLQPILQHTFRTNALAQRCHHRHGASSWAHA
jgi:DNA (cytosine-5)-methyltransferase 1